MRDTLAPSVVPMNDREFLLVCGINPEDDLGRLPTPNEKAMIDALRRKGWNVARDLDGRWAAGKPGTSKGALDMQVAYDLYAAPKPVHRDSERSCTCFLGHPPCSFCESYDPDKPADDEEEQ
jgi:hypothetical protein